jgi:hypothetical protein
VEKRRVHPQVLQDRGDVQTLLNTASRLAGIACKFDLQLLHCELRRSGAAGDTDQMLDWFTRFISSAALSFRSL